MDIPDETTTVTSGPRNSNATDAYGSPAGLRSDTGTANASQALLGTNVDAGNGNSAPHPIPDSSTRPANAITHTCGAWWTGLSRAHCPACHRTFSTDNAANKHRVGKHGIDRHCADPATVGLVAVEKPYGTLWQSPAPEGGYTFHTAPQRDDSAEHEATAQAFNAAHPVGTPVLAYPGARDGRAIRTRTTHAAYVLQGHTPVVFVADHEACIALTHIDPTEEPTP